MEDTLLSLEVVPTEETPTGEPSTWGRWQASKRPVTRPELRIVPADTL